MSPAVRTPRAVGPRRSDAGPATASKPSRAAWPSFTLLISPDAFDLSQPIKVTANGKTVFDAKVQPSTATLMKWAARDNDRTMLYAAEIEIKLSR